MISKDYNYYWQIKKVAQEILSEHQLTQFMGQLNEQKVIFFLGSSKPKLRESKLSFSIKEILDRRGDMFLPENDVAKPICENNIELNLNKLIMSYFINTFGKYYTFSWGRDFFKRVISSVILEGDVVSLVAKIRVIELLLPFGENLSDKKKFLENVIKIFKALGLSRLLSCCQRALELCEGIEKPKKTSASDYFNQLCTSVGGDFQTTEEDKHFSFLNMMATLGKKISSEQVLEIELTNLVDQLKYLKGLKFEVGENLIELLSQLTVFLNVPQEKSVKSSQNRIKVCFKFEELEKIIPNITLKSLAEFSEFIIGQNCLMQQTFFRYFTNRNFIESKALPCESMTENELVASLRKASRKGQPYFVRYVLQHLEKKIKLPKFKLELFGKQYKVKKLFISDLEEFNKVYLQKGHRQNMACEFKKQLGIVLLKLIDPTCYKFSSGMVKFTMKTATQYLQFIKVLETYKLFTDQLFSKFMRIFDYGMVVSDGVYVKDEGRLVRKLDTIKKNITTSNGEEIVTGLRDIRMTASSY